MATKPEHDERLAPLLVDVHVACVLLSISRTTLYALIDDGVLRPRKIGRRSYFASMISAILPMKRRDTRHDGRNRTYKEMKMPSNSDLQLICDRISQAVTEFKAHVITFANLQGEIKTAQARHSRVSRPRSPKPRLRSGRLALDEFWLNTVKPLRQ